MLSLSGCTDEPETHPAEITSVSVSDDGQTIVATWAGSVCDKLEIASADERSNEISLDFAVSNEGDMCDLALIYSDVSTPLSHPLDDRLIVDGATGEPLTPVAR